MGNNPSLATRGHSPLCGIGTQMRARAEPAQAWTRPRKRVIWGIPSSPLTEPAHENRREDAQASGAPSHQYAAWAALPIVLARRPRPPSSPAVLARRSRPPFSPAVLARRPLPPALVCTRTILRSTWVEPDPGMQGAMWAGVLGFLKGTTHTPGFGFWKRSRVGGGFPRARRRIMEGVRKCLRIGAEDKDTDMRIPITQLCARRVSPYGARKRYAERLRTPAAPQAAPHAASAETPANARAVVRSQLVAPCV
ncbi:hypothetical protein B0H17DRAFT_1213694 [Mycena rosella]|uniref:Uncharacterized protein n=1 Tax=Mycena rosella TaxID=1033263 RepID=A0AAD7CPN9_MYCRO|nr:hypothetical protein B0H17DRAFT_1213694 [Mycena rosella]